MSPPLRCEDFYLTPIRSSISRNCKARSALYRLFRSHRVSLSTMTIACVPFSSPRLA